MSRVGVACLISILSVGLLQFVLQVPERQVAHSSSCTTQVEDGTHPEAQHRGGCALWQAHSGRTHPRLTCVHGKVNII